MKEIKITDIEGFRIGNAQDAAAATGCTAVICEKGAAAGCDVRGGGPATRETQCLRSENLAEKIHCVMISGGSAYGLDAGSGAMQFLEEKNIGFDCAVAKVPIVCGASLFDLAVGSSEVRPDKRMGYEACENAFSETELKTGNFGAGTGATVGKYCGMQYAMKSGLGTYALQEGDVKCGAVVAVNCLGDVYDIETGEKIAGMLSEDGKSFKDTKAEMIKKIDSDVNVFTDNTTLGCIVTNAVLTKAQCNKIASMVHNGFARAIKPVHTSADGDTVFVMSTCEVKASMDALGSIAADVMSLAIRCAVSDAGSAYGYISAESMRNK